MYIYIYIYMYVYMYICKYLYMYICICKYMFIYMYIYIYVINKCIYIYMYTCLYVYIYILYVFICRCGYVDQNKAIFGLICLFQYMQARLCRGFLNNFRVSSVSNLMDIKWFTFYLKGEIATLCSIATGCLRAAIINPRTSIINNLPTQECRTCTSSRGTRSFLVATSGIWTHIVLSPVYLHISSLSCCHCSIGF